MKKVYIGFAFSHHKNSQGGYHHIKEYLNYDTIIDVQREKEFIESPSKNILFRIFRRIYIYLLGQGTPLGVIRVIFLSIFKKNQVFHFIYAENTYKWLHHFKGKTNKTVCTFHQPASYFINNPEWIPILKKIDKIILMTEADLDQFEKWTGKKNVFFIPHGINCNYYTYDSSIVKTNSVLMVGNWLRDFELAAVVFKRLNDYLPEVEINIVTFKDNWKYFESLKVNLFTNITDDELKMLYQTSKLVFFPLKQFTANNAVLEAASCGCDILIATPDKPDYSYFSDQYIHYSRNDKEQIVNTFKKIINNGTSNSNERVGKYVKETFSWETVAIKTERILTNKKN